MDEDKSNFEIIEEEISEKTDKSENLELSKVEENDENKSQNFENREEPESEKIDNKSENVDQNDLDEKTIRSGRSSVESNQHISRTNSPLISRSVNFELKKKRLNSSSSSSKSRISDFYLSSVNEMKYIGEQFKVGRINPQAKSPFEERFEKRYAKTLKKLTTNSNNFSSNKILSDYRQTRDPKCLTDHQIFVVNELKYTDQQFKCGKMDPRAKSPFEERFEKRYAKTLKKMTANSKNFDQNEMFSIYRRTKDSKNLLDQQLSLVNELKYTDQQFKFGKLDPRAKPLFEEKFQNKYKERLEILFPNSNRMSMVLSYNDLKNIHNTLTISKNIKDK